MDKSLHRVPSRGPARPQGMRGTPAHGRVCTRLTSSRSTALCGVSAASSSQPDQPAEVTLVYTHNSSASSSQLMGAAIRDAKTKAAVAAAALTSAAMPRVVSVTYTDSGKAVPGWDLPGRQFGNQHITVHLQGSSGSDDLNFMDSAALRVLNVTAQVLVHIRSKHVFHHKKSTWYKGKGAAAALTRLAKILSVSEPDVADMADAPISARNKLIHPESLSALDQEVHVALTLFESLTPQLKRFLKFEHQVLKAYDSIKRAFPDRFC